MKKFLLTLVLFFFTLPIFSQNFEDLKQMITYYGYEVNIETEEILDNQYLVIQSVNNDFTEYDHITYVIAVSRAIMKYSEMTNLLSFYAGIEFKSGEHSSDLTIEDLELAATYDDRRIQQEYLNAQRK